MKLGIEHFGDKFFVEVEICGENRSATLHSPPEYQSLDIVSVKDHGGSEIDIGLEHDIWFQEKIWEEINAINKREA